MKIKTGDSQTQSHGAGILPGLPAGTAGPPARLRQDGTLDLDLRSGLDGYGRRGLGEQVDLPVGIQQDIGARRDRGSFAAGILDPPEALLGAYESDLLEDRFGPRAGNEQHRDLLAELGQPDLGEVSIAIHDTEVNPQLMAQLGGEGREFTEEAEADSAQGATRAKCGGILLGGLVRILGSELRHKRREVVLLRSFYFGDSLFLGALSGVLRGGPTSSTPETLARRRASLADPSQWLIPVCSGLRVRRASGPEENLLSDPHGLTRGSFDYHPASVVAHEFEILVGNRHIDLGCDLGFDVPTVFDKILLNVFYVVLDLVNGFQNGVWRAIGRHSAARWCDHSVSDLKDSDDCSLAGPAVAPQATQIA